MEFRRRSYQSLFLTAALMSSTPSSFAAPLLSHSPASPQSSLNQQLWDAADQGHTAQVRALLQKGASPESRNAEGDTALMSASYANSLAIVRILIQHGAHINTSNKHGYTALTSALYGGSPSTALFLVEHGAQLNTTLNSKTPLQLAVNQTWDREKNWNGVVKLMLRKGALVDGRKPGSYTPLMIAATLGSRDVAQMLIAHGADVNAKTAGGTTALMLAADFNSFAGPEKTEIAQLLLKKGADIKARTVQGNTALINAARTGATDSVRVLLQGGASVKSADRKRALRVARERKRIEIVRLLKKR